MDLMSNNNMVGLKTKEEIKVSDHNLSVNEGPSDSCREVRARFRPKLQSTKSFPPYSKCIGGLGEDEESDNHTDSVSKFAHQPSDAMMGDDSYEEVQSLGRKEESELQRGCRREEVKAKWRSRRKERFGGSFDKDRWESGKWNAIRTSGESEASRECDDDDSDGEGHEDERKRERKHHGGKKREEVDEEREIPPVSAVQQKVGEMSVETPYAEQLPGIQEDSNIHQWSSPHPLAKLLHSSSSSSCSSINLSTEESDEVFSEGEDTNSKRRTLRKCRSWKTYLTMMHWSLRRQSSWVQLSGHQGSFQLSDNGEVLKLYSEVEERCLDFLMRDSLRPFVPQYHGLVTRGEHCYVRLDDLLSGMRRPVIMDCKMGVRTFQEEEIIRAQSKSPLRTDMYQKMVKSDPSAPSAEEHAQKAVTKLRYLQWRDTTSSTSTLGFRIEGIMMDDGSVQRDFRKILHLAQATEVLLYFSGSHVDILKAYYSRLLALSEALKSSMFFRTHEVIGSSLLFVHDHSGNASIWMIDFGKTTPMPDRRELLHNVPWTKGSREDGYMIGLNSLIVSLGQAISVASLQQQGDSGAEKMLPEVR